MTVWTTGDRIGEEGGFGVVYRSRKKIDGILEDIWYAKKKLNRDDEDSIKRFQKEVRLSQRLKHPRIIDIVAYSLNSEPYFYIMPLYERSMQSVMSDIKNDYSRIKNIFNQIFDGVEYLHSEGVFHRDLKPANILLNSDVDLVISDFGLGVQIDSKSTRLTKTWTGMGTEFFASPEQRMDAKNVDCRTDIYSLGCMLYLCFIEEEWDTHVAIEKMPPVIDYVVRKATAYRKEGRFQSVDSLRQSFNAAIDRLLGVKIKDNFEDILDRIKTGDLTEDLIDSVALILSSSISNSDHIHETMMSLSPEQFNLLCSKHFDISKRALNVLKEYITNQGWSFNYTDTLGRQCYNLYHSIENFELRAILIYIIVQVGSSHNRWYVINLAKEILKSIKNDGEAFEVANIINDLSWEIESLELNKEDLYGELKKLVKEV